MHVIPVTVHLLAYQSRFTFCVPRSQETHVREVAAAEFVRQVSVDDEIPEATDVGVLDDKIAATVRGKTVPGDFASPPT
jgi:hypothetical protein